MGLVVLPLYQLIDRKSWNAASRTHGVLQGDTMDATHAPRIALSNMNSPQNNATGAARPDEEQDQ